MSLNVEAVTPTFERIADIGSQIRIRSIYVNEVHSVGNGEVKLPLHRFSVLVHKSFAAQRDCTYIKVGIS
jgi:hypothetical protein